MDYNDSEDIKEVRAKYNQQIRKVNREQFISKRRNMQALEPVVEGDWEMGIDAPPKQKKFIIVDDTYRVQIAELILQDYTLEMLPELVNNLHSNAILVQHRGAIGIRKIISSGINPPVQQIVDAHVVPRLIEMIKQNALPQLQLQAAWILTNIASGTTQQCACVIEKGGLEVFIKLLNQNKYGIVEQAIWAIGNIAGDCTQARDLIINLGGVESLIRIIRNSQSQNIVRHGSWSLSNLCRGNPMPKYDLVKKAVPLLCSVVLNDVLDEENLNDVFWALSFLCQGSKSKIQRIVETGVLPKIIAIGKTLSMKVLLPTLRMIGNISTGNELHTEEIFNGGALDLLCLLLDNEKKTLRREACWILSNLAAGTKSQVDQIINYPNLMQKILRLFELDAEEIRREICYIYSNITNMGDLQRAYCIVSNESVINSFAGLLISENRKTLEDVLTCLYSMWNIGEKLKQSAESDNILVQQYMRVPNFIERLEGLQHQNDKIYAKVTKIMHKYLLVENTNIMQI